MELIQYAEKELSLIGSKDDEMQQLMNSQILEILKVFADQGHSGFSANYLINKLDRLIRCKPLTQLTGEDDEWVLAYTTRDGISVYQNVRCSSVFKEVQNGKDIKCYDIDSALCSDNGGITWFQSKRFYKPITFPYAPPIHPEHVYIEYTEDVPPGETGDEFEIITDQPERIQALYKRKRAEFDAAEADYPD